MGNLKSWLDASEANFLSTAASTSPPNDDDSIFQWYDLSGNGHHAKVKAGTPKWDATGFNSKPGVMLNGAGLVLDDSKIAFDAWSKLHVFHCLLSTRGQKLCHPLSEIKLRGMDG